MAYEKKEFAKKDLSVKGFGKPVYNREFGEILESKLTPEETAKNAAEQDPSKRKKPSLYIKITASPEELSKLQTGFTISMEDPKEKFKRQLVKFVDDEMATENITERMNKIPSFVKKRLIMRIPVE